MAKVKCAPAMLIGSTSGFRHCAMAANACNLNSKQCAACHSRSFATQHQAGRASGMDMKSKTCLQFWIFQYTRVQHIFCTGETFVILAEKKTNLTVPSSRS